MPEGLKNFVNSISEPWSIFLLSVLFVAVIMKWPKQFGSTAAGWGMLIGFTAFYAVSMTDKQFLSVVAKADNVPITMMLVTVGFFTWLAFRKGSDNDERIARGQPTWEQEHERRVMVWPNLVYTELICLILLSVGLIIWSILLKAPLEPPANPNDAPNPSKAPWYFLGLQEMLVYYDPWLAGVVFPTLIIVGLMAIPYIDVNKKGNGYYTIKERPFAISLFLFGFIPLWVVLIMLGTFLRGPNWNFFGFYEQWDVHKVVESVNINVSQIFWVKMLGRGMPDHWSLRELPGFVVVIAYFGIIPPLLAKTVFRKMYLEMGFLRYNVMAFLLLSMAAMPLKMVLRWLFNLKYIVAVTEHFFNI
jgi:hypothetical protein